MAKVTKAAGPTFTETELSDPVPSETLKKYAPPPKVTRFMVGSESESVGNSSSQSSNEESSSNETPRKDPQGPARTTESPSSHSVTDDSGVDSTGGNGPEMDTESDEVPPYVDWLKEDLKEECRARDLPVSGTVSELAARLDQDDAESSEK